jgi:hypothetical protein
MASQLKLTIVGDPTPLRNATRVAEKSLRSLLANANKTSAGINKAFGAVGLGLGFATLTNGLKQATKAASDDRKSQGLLAQALQKTVGATDSAIKGAEDYVRKTQLSTSVLDDDLRPALAAAVRATGSLTTGQRLLDAALDVSASTGKDLGSVTGALSKAFNGNQGALKKLVPGLKLTGNVLADVERGFNGAAEKAAQLDPYKRLEVVFADIQEQIGTALLPALEEFTAYITTPDGQKNIKQVVDGFVSLGKAVVTVTRFLIDNATAVKAIVAALVVLRTGWALSTSAVNLYTSVTGKAVTATKALRVALITTGIGALVVALGFLAEGWITANEEKDNYFETFEQGASGSTVPYGPGIAADGVSWIALGFGSEQEYLDDLAKTKNVIIENRDKALKAIADTGKKFRDAVGISFGLFGKDENSVFNVDFVLAKLKRVVDAARGFKSNLEKLKNAGAGQDVINELVALGPAQGNIAAKGLLQSGKLSQFLGLRGSLQATGESVQGLANNVSENRYEININKANVSAEDIIKAITSFEKKTGKKVFSN